MGNVSIRDICTVIRSKQAGPFRLTFDLLFKTKQLYEIVKMSGAISKRQIADLYQIPEEKITDFVFYDPGLALKISIVRPKVAGDPGDGDVYGCQQHAPLLGLKLSLPDVTEDRMK
jgi:hypothetical protein